MKRMQTARTMATVAPAGHMPNTGSLDDLMKAAGVHQATTMNTPGNAKMPSRQPQAHSAVGLGAKPNKPKNHVRPTFDKPIGTI